MAENIIINPVTRISGFMEIQVEVEKNKIINARNSGLIFRGFEKMLKGRPPLDAVYFTERICGICSMAHGLASSLALENILGIVPEENNKMLRDFMTGCEFLQNHLRQFYQFTVPDFAWGPDISPVYSTTVYKLPERLNLELNDHYKESFTYSKYAHEMSAVLGGKVPHTHGLFVGGVTVNLDAAKFIKIKSLLDAIKEFVNTKMIFDAHIIAEYYPEYYYIGEGYKNLLTYGLYDGYAEEELFYVAPRVMIEGVVQEFDESKITENIHRAWYMAKDKEIHRPLETDTTDTMHKEEAYSFIKAPRYDGYAMEVGPIARMWFSGDYRKGFSTMDRIMARVLEVKKMIDIMEGLLARVELKRAWQGIYDFFLPAKGQGLVDTTRGSLGHWISVSDNMIQNYDIITPSAWNLSPEDSSGVKGTLENALMGNAIRDLENPIEIGRIARSFDPCVSCATHVISDRYEPMRFRIV